MTTTLNNNNKNEDDLKKMEENLNFSNVRVFTLDVGKVTNQFLVSAPPLKLTNQITACADVVPRPGF